MEFEKRGLLKPSGKELINLPSKNAKALYNCFCKVGKLRGLCGCRKWFSVLARLAMSMSQKCHEIAWRKKTGVKTTKEARRQLSLLMAWIFFKQVI